MYLAACRKDLDRWGYHKSADVSPLVEGTFRAYGTAYAASNVLVSVASLCSHLWLLARPKAERVDLEQAVCLFYWGLGARRDLGQAESFHFDRPSTARPYMILKGLCLQTVLTIAKWFSPR